MTADTTKEFTGYRVRPEEEDLLQAAADAYIAEIERVAGMAYPGGLAEWGDEKFAMLGHQAMNGLLNVHMDHRVKTIFGFGVAFGAATAQMPLNEGVTLMNCFQRGFVTGRASKFTDDQLADRKPS